MKSSVTERVERLTSDKKLPVIEILNARRTEICKALITMRDPQEIARLQGKAEELDFLISAFEK